VARVLFHGGTVLVPGPTAPPVDAIVVDDGVIVAVGPDADPRGVGYDEVVDLRGRSLLPAFRDGHAHPLHAGLHRLELDLAGLDSLDAVLAAVREWDRRHPGTSWIVGRCYEPTILPDGFGRAAWLDAAVAHRPVALLPNDAHSVWVNSAALTAAGVTADTPDPPHGVVVRDAAGAPIGHLLEFGAVDLVRRFFPPVTAERSRAGLREGVRALTHEGVVWVQDASVTVDELHTYVDGAAAGELTCRVNVAFRAEPDRWPTQCEEFVAARAAAAVAAPWVSAGTVKFFADGVIESGTGYLLEPYDDRPAGAAHRCGLPNWSPDALADAVRTVDALGFQVHVHAIGDAGVRMTLDAIEHAVRVNGERDRRPVIAHVQLVHPDDRPRFAQLGVVANFEPLWAAYDEFTERLTLPRLGPARTAMQYPIGSMLAVGSRISFGSDWPVSSHRPLEGLATAVTRTNRRGEPVGGWVPGERVPMLAAIAAYTAGTAHQAFDDGAGRIAVGQRADVVITDCDVTTIGGEDLPGVRVDETWLAGGCVFRAA
jgi:predicted amidohydrolase YtcJ